VLTGLEEECRKPGKCDLEFDKSIRVISSVSGGSVGAMYFLNEYEKGSLPDTDAELEQIVKRAEKSSLDYVVWGLIYPDFARLFNILPLGLEWLDWDRGRALQQAWLREDMTWDTREGVQDKLSQWRNDARVGDRPAVIFNTAVAETGQRLALTTTEPIEGRSLTHERLLRLFDEDETSTDVSVVTATRLSATFPYASPAARANIEEAAYHLVDGGYYDNYGIISLVEWLNDELGHNPDIKKVLVVEIDAAGGDCTTEVQQSSSTADADAGDQGITRAKRGWIFQSYAPLWTVLQVRAAAQQGNNEVALDLLEGKWDEEGEKEDDTDVDIVRSCFSFDGPNPPTSWHLTEGQKRDIDDYWVDELEESSNTTKGWDKVEGFLDECCVVW
jgi:hypothetical protein